ncbi:MAG: helix-hairpin-helix domain-containing protein [Fimbriimonas sp.]
MRRERGSAFVLSLAVLAGLVAVLASIMASQHTALQAQYGRQDRVRARRAAESGIQRALAEMTTIAAANPGSETATTSTNSATGNAVTLQDPWAQLGQNGDERFTMGRESFRVQIVDAASRLNVNTAPQEQLERLPLTVEQIESLLDYREESRDPRAQGGKDEYYGNLPEPYNAKLRVLETVDELLQIRGWTPDILYRPITDVASNTPLPEDANGQVVPLIDLFTVSSYSPQLDPNGEARINVNTANAQQRLLQAGFSPQAATQISSRTNWASIGEIAATLQGDDQQRALDYLAVNGQPRIAGLMNINTAPEELLATLPGMTPDAAAAIVQRQGQGFASLGELTSIPGVTAEVLTQAAGRLTAISQVFIVRVVGMAGESEVALEAIVDVADGQPRLRQILDVPYSNVEARWGWAEETTTETILREGS